MHPTRLAAGLLALGVLLTACPPPGGNDGGGGENDGGGVNPGVDAGNYTDLCTDRWALLCKAWATCDSSAAYFPTTYTSEADCVARGSANCLEFFGSGAARPGTPGTPEDQLLRFGACTAAIASRSACDVVNNYVFGNGTDLDLACVAQQGSLPPGASCVIGDQCSTSLCRFQAGCGTCEAQSDVNGSCTFSSDCKLGLGCNQGVCVQVLGPDAGCSFGAVCKPELACLGGNCRPRLAAGDACDPNSANPCKLGYCNPKTRKCEDFKLDGKAGQICGVDPATSTVTGCERNSTCLIVTQSFQGECVPRVQRGDRCFFDQSFQGSQCQVFSACINGVCAAPGVEPTCGRDGGAAPARRDGGVLPARDGGNELAETNRQTTLLCDAISACPRWAPQADVWYGGRANCDAALAPLNANFLGDPRGYPSLADLTTCNDTLAALGPCELADRLLGARPVPPQCTAKGFLPQGSVCAGEYACSPGSSCTAGSLAPGCGICLGLSGVGGICAFSNNCQAGLACAGGRCVAGGGSGATCSAAAPCSLEYVCKAGLCVDPQDADAGCSAAVPTCAQPLYCSPSRGKCEPTTLPNLASGLIDGGVTDGGIEGTLCGLLGGGLTFCPYGFQCKLTDAQAFTGYCDPSHGEGQSCWSGGLDNRGQCRFPLLCNNGVCTSGDKTWCQ